MSLMRQGKPKQAMKLKGVYTLNPTKAVMKQGSEKARKAVSGSKKTKQPVKAKGKTK
jgi:hypothetical protein